MSAIDDRKATPWGGSGALYLQPAIARWNSLLEAKFVRSDFNKWC
jgi:hypothetical protein